MRSIAAVVAGILAAALAFGALAILMVGIAGTECDRGECNAFGEWLDESDGAATISFAVVAVVSLLVGGLVARRVWRATR
jgi:hypothetical protein